MPLVPSYFRTGSVFDPLGGKLRQVIELAGNYPGDKCARSIDFTLQKVSKVSVEKRRFAVLKRKTDLEDKRQLRLIEAVDLLENRTHCSVRKDASADGSILIGGTLIAIELKG